LLSRVAELLRKLIDYQMFQHSFTRCFRREAATSILSPLPRKHPSEARGSAGARPRGHAAQSKEAILVPDVSKDPRYIEGNPETRSELAVPLIYKDKVIGVLRPGAHAARFSLPDDHRRS